MHLWCKKQNQHCSSVMLSSQNAVRESLVYHTESMLVLIICFCRSVVFLAVPEGTGDEKYDLLLLIPLSAP